MIQSQRSGPQLDEYPNWVKAPTGPFGKHKVRHILDFMLSKISHWAFQEEDLHRSFKIGDCPNDISGHPLP